MATYVRESLAAAARLRPEHRFVALSVGGRNETVRLAEHLGGLPETVERRHRRVRGAAPLRRLVNSVPLPLLEPLAGRCDAFVDSEWLYPRQRHGVRIAVVHDLIPLRFPEWTTAPTRGMHLRKLDDVRRADAVVTNSAATARDVAERLGVPEQRLHVARPGVADAFRTAAPAAPGPAGGRPYLLAVGTLEPRKNLPALLDAYALVRRDLPELALVLVARPGLGRRPGGPAGGRARPRRRPRPHGLPAAGRTAGRRRGRPRLLLADPFRGLRDARRRGAGGRRAGGVLGRPVAGRGGGDAGLAVRRRATPRRWPAAIRPAGGGPGRARTAGAPCAGTTDADAGSHGGGGSAAWRRCEGLEDDHVNHVARHPRAVRRDPERDAGRSATRWRRRLTSRPIHAENIHVTRALTRPSR